MNPFADPEHEIDYGKKGKDVFVPSKLTAPQLVVPDLGELVDLIDFSPACNGEKKTQDEWLAFYNKQEGEAKGKQMITAPDIYKAIRDVYLAVEHGIGGPALLFPALLRKDIGKSALITGTRIIYDGDTFAGKVVHNFNSTVAKPIEIAVAEIPVYQSEEIKNIIEGKGLAYVQALFNTNDDAATIIKTLENLSQKKAEDIRFWTSEKSSRKKIAERVVRFVYDRDGFHVDGDGWDNNDGCSRGVKLK